MGGVACSKVGLDGDHCFHDDGSSFGGSLAVDLDEVVEENGRLLFLFDVEFLK